MNDISMNDMNLNRRKFLQTASVIATAVATLPGLSAVAGVLTPEAKLADGEREVFEKILKVCLPTKGSSLIDPLTLPVMPTLEGALMAGMPPHIRQGLRGGVGYFDEGPQAEHGKTFVELTDEQATEFIEQWADSDQVPERALAFGLKKLTMLSYWAIPNTWVPIGYDGPVSDKWNIQPLGNTPEPNA